MAAASPSSTSPSANLTSSLTKGFALATYPPRRSVPSTPILSPITSRAASPAASQPASRRPSEDLASLPLLSPDPARTAASPLSQTLPSDDCDNLPITIQGFSSSPWRIVAFALVSVLTLGLYPLLCSWFPKLYTRSTCHPAPLASASHVVVSRASSEAGLPELLPVTCNTLEGTRSFSYHHLRYSLNFAAGEGVFSLALSGLSIPAADVPSKLDGLTSTQAQALAEKFGENTMVVPIPPLVRQVLVLLLHPIYAFQLFSLTFWAWEDYIKYSYAIGFLMVIAIYQQITKTRETLRSLNSLASHSVPVIVRRNGEPRAMVSPDLVPGDVVHLRANFLVPCDMVLLTGQATINEAMLTGEATPVIKSAFAPAVSPPVAGDGEQTASPPLFDVETTAPDSVLWAGTSVLQVSPPPNGEQVVRALVVRTGFATRKGALLRAMLYPKPSHFSFMADSIKFLAVLLAVAVAAFIFLAVRLHATGVRILRVYAEQGGDLLTVVIPPALPIAMTIGISFAVLRLQQRRIVTLNPDRINVSGKVRFVAFDKTGTLTEDGLNVVGVAPAAALTADPVWPSRASAGALVDVLATAHSLTLLEPPSPSSSSSSTNPASVGSPRSHTTSVSSGSQSGEEDTIVSSAVPVGDPLDVSMFAATKYVLSRGLRTPSGKTWPESVFAALPPGARGSVLTPALGEPGRAWLIARRLEFNPQVARMSAVAVALDDSSVWLHCKGAPERVLETCDKASVPAHTVAALENYTRQGYRVLALSARRLDPGMTLVEACAASTTRQDLEKDCTFMGFLLLHNKIKDDSPAVIADLRAASLRTVMVTGDYPLTAAFVAQHCGIASATRPVYLSVPSQTSLVEWKCIAGPPELLGTVRCTEDVLPLAEDLSADDAVDPGHGAGSAELVVSGSMWKLLFAAAFPDGEVVVDVGGPAQRDAFVRICLRTSVFARFTPTQKAQLMEVSQALGYFGMMCGDGANDCPALAAAHVGVSLSEAEASVAAPFTSKNSSIACTREVIREGRAALVTSFQCFKYMAMYSIIQVASMVILFSFYSSLGDPQFLFIDLGLIVPLGILMGRIPPAAGPLPSARPHGRLTSHYIVLSLLGQSVLAVGFQVAALGMLLAQPWYEPFVPETGHRFYVDVAENTVVFLMSSFQYVFVVVSFSVAAPHRRAWWRIPAFAWTVVGLTAACIGVLFMEVETGNNALNLVNLPYDFRWKLLGLVALYAVLSFVWERAVIVAPWYHRWRQQGKQPSRKPFKVVLSQLASSPPSSSFGPEKASLYNS